MSDRRCPVCAGEVLEPVATIDRMPVLCNSFVATADEARAMPWGSIDLVACVRCGMLHNAAFDPALAPYDSAYENSLHFSPRFQAFARGLAEDLAARYGVAGGTVVEIGSGAGDFLAMVAEAGFDRGVGVDPSLEAGRQRRAGAAELTFVPGSVAELPEGVVADLVVSRHVLEHVVDPVGLLRDARRHIARTGTRIYVEVPDGEHMLRAPAVWDLVYEHAGYFTAPALAYALSAGGWADVRTGTSFGGQYLWAEAVAAPDAKEGPGHQPPAPAAGEVSGIVAGSRAFAAAFRRAVERWEAFVEAERAAARKVAVWGAGSKGVAFCNLVAPPVDAVIDVNPRKHGRYVPGRGLQVVAPGDAGHIDTVLVMNPLYRDEIARAGAGAGLDATYHVAEP